MARSADHRYSRRGFLGRIGVGVGAAAVSGGVGALAPARAAPPTPATRSRFAATTSQNFGRIFPNLQAFAPANQGVTKSLTALGVGLWLSALNVKYRDVRYTITFLVQFWLFATPVAYPSSIVPERWRMVYGLNPMAGVVEGFRWALLNHSEFPGSLLAVSTAVITALLISGLYYFRRMERTFADVI